jgi:signal transduction histidine kinase
MSLWGHLSHRAAVLAAVVLAALLAFLAVLQYRWIGEVSRADRERLRASMESAGARFTEEFDREVTRALLNFSPPLRGMDPAAELRGKGRASDERGKGRAADEAERKIALVEAARRWRSQAADPELVRDVFLAEAAEAPQPGRAAGDQGAAGELALSRLDPAAGSFVPVPWPAELEPLRRRLAAGDRGGVPPFDGEDAALVLPLVRSFGSPAGPPAHGAGARVIVQLDRRFITAELLPELAERWFGLSREPQVLLAVANSQGIVYRSNPSLPERRFLPGDLTLPMFGMRRLDGPHGSSPGTVPGSPAPGTHRFSREGRPGHRHGMGGIGGRGAGSWKLVVTHRAGSLEAAVDRVRVRNLAVSFGVLALLGASFAVIGLSLRRARQIARQQLDLVAGITHELNTPLAAIRSAGQNLADGVVAEGGQVRRYGALIEREGARLSGMVAQALELAGIQSGQRAYRPEAVPVAEVVAEALAAARFLLEERGMAVEREIPAGLPAVWADRGALRLALGNLLDNAAKYASAGRFVAIRAAAERGGRQVSLTVEDRGPGIPAEDRPHLFEPFYRGQNGREAAGKVAGSGLGLSLVRRIAQAHRGSVAVAAGPGGKGSAFTLRLPAAPRAGETAVLGTPETLEMPEEVT